MHKLSIISLFKHTGRLAQSDEVTMLTDDELLKAKRIVAFSRHEQVHVRMQLQNNCALLVYRDNILVRINTSYEDYTEYEIDESLFHENNQNNFIVGDTVEIYCPTLSSKKFTEKIIDIDGDWLIFKNDSKIQHWFCTKI